MSSDCSGSDNGWDVRRVRHFAVVGLFASEAIAIGKPRAVAVKSGQGYMWLIFVPLISWTSTGWSASAKAVTSELRRLVQRSRRVCRRGSSWRIC